MRNAAVQQAEMPAGRTRTSHSMPAVPQQGPLLTLPLAAQAVAVRTLPVAVRTLPALGAKPRPRRSARAQELRRKHTEASRKSAHSHVQAKASLKKPS